MKKFLRRKRDSIASPDAISTASQTIFINPSTTETSLQESILTVRTARRAAQLPQLTPTQSPVEIWTQEIRKIHSASDGKPSIDELRAQTDLHLCNQNGEKSPEEWKKHVADLVRNHSQKRCAFLACIHVLSTEDARAILLELEDNHYLDLLVETSKSHEDIISEVEGRYAKTLYELENSNLKHIEKLRLIEGLLTEAVSDELHLATKANQISRQTCRQFCDHLSHVKQSHNWTKSGLNNEACTWLHNLILTSPVRQLLDEIDRKWLAWASWRPNRNRLKIYKNHSEILSKPMLRSIVALEGPDFNTLSRETLKDSYETAVHFANSPFAELLDEFDDVAEVTESLLLLLDTTLLFSPQDLPLVEKFYVNSPVKTSLLIALGIACQGDDPSSAIAYLKLFTSNDGQANQLSAVLDLAPRLGSDSSIALRQLLSASIIQTVEEGLEQSRARICREIDSKKMIDLTAKNIYKNVAKAQNCRWLFQALSEGTRIYIENLPPEPALQNLITLRKQCQGKSTSAKDMASLGPYIESYLKTKFGRGTQGSTEDSSVMFSVIDIYQESKRQPTRDLALKLGLNQAIPAELRSLCLEKLPIMRETMIKAITESLGDDIRISSVQMVKRMAEPDFRTSKGYECWDRLLHWMLTLQGRTPGSAIKTTKDWVNFITDLQSITHKWPRALEYKVDRDLASWAEDLRDFIPELAVLEGKLAGNGMQWIFSNPDHKIAAVLPLLGQKQPESIKQMNQVLMKALKNDGSNLRTYFNHLEMLRSTTNVGQKRISRILSLYNVSSAVVAEAYFTAWSKHRELQPDDQRFLKLLAKILNLKLDRDSTGLKQLMKGSMKHIDDEFKLLLDQFYTLHKIYQSLHFQNPRRTRQLVNDLDVNIPRGQASGRVPSPLVDMIEELSPKVYELFFPLTHLKPLQKKAMGIGDSRSMVVRIIFAGHRVHEFCIHLQGGKSDYSNLQGTHRLSIIGDTNKHSTDSSRYSSTYGKLSAKEKNNIQPSSLTTMANSLLGTKDRKYNDNTSNASYSRDPLYGKTLHEPAAPSAQPKKAVPLFKYQSCSDNPSRLIFSLNQAIHAFSPRDDTSLTPIYTLIDTSIEKFARACIICSSPLPGTGLFRSTTCSPACSDLWKQAPAAIRLSELQDDPEVADLLLSAAYAAAVSFNTTQMSTLPPSPFREYKILDLIKDIPSLYTSPLSLTETKASLISWTLREYGGFLSKATGIFAIPELNGVHQFILAHSASSTHAAFTRAPKKRGTVMFHGTTLDRLYSILCTGLQNLSNTAYEVNGRAAGTGIYLAEEPTLSMSYAIQNAGWPKSKFQNIRVLLGCEALRVTNSGPVLGRAANEICTVGRPEDVAVRYVFLFESWAKIPFRKDIVPAMEIAYAALWSGVA